MRAVKMKAWRLVPWHWYYFPVIWTLRYTRNTNDIDMIHIDSDVLWPPAIRRMGEGNSFSLFTFRGGRVPDPALDGGFPGLRFSGGVPGLRFSGGEGGRGSQVSDFGGGWVPGLRFLGKLPGLRFLGGEGGYLVSVKGKIFVTRFGLIHVQTRKNFFAEGPPPRSKGKNFWQQIWIDTCSDQKNFFCWGTPPSKGKTFWHQIWLDTCADWEKFFCQGTPPVKGKFFDTRFGLIHVQTGKKIFVKRPPPE